MNRKLFVANISWNVSEEDVYHLFNGIGPIESLKLPIHRPSGRHRGYGFVEMKNELDAKRVVEELNGMQLDNRPLAVNFQDEARTRQDRDEAPPEPNRKLFIRNIGPTVAEQTLVELFGQAGTIESFKIPTDRYTGEQRTYGFAEMSTVEEAQLVVERFNEYMLGGEALQINFADPSRIRARAGGNNKENLSEKLSEKLSESSIDNDVTKSSSETPITPPLEPVQSEQPATQETPEVKPEPTAPVDNEKPVDNAPLEATPSTPGHYPAFQQQPKAPFESPEAPKVFDPFEQPSPWT